jgi:TrkA domain protein
MEVFETPLPGIGVRYELTTAAGDPLGVVVRRDGRRQIVVYDRSDPDRTRASLSLAPSEASALVELLGGSKVTERLAALRQDVEGLSIEWVTLPASGGLTGQTIGEGAVRSRTGASVVAVIRGEQSTPGPGPDFRFAAGDVALVIGAVAAVRAAVEVLTG